MILPCEVESPSKMTSNCRDRLYQNSGNPGLMDMLDRHAGTILDVGCGAGANAALIRRDKPTAKIYGITMSSEEARVAGIHFDRVWVCDVEERFPEQLSKFRFDAIIFSHVLEHLRDPAEWLPQQLNYSNMTGACSSLCRTWLIGAS